MGQELTKMASSKETISTQALVEMMDGKHFETYPGSGQPCTDINNCAGYTAFQELIRSVQEKTPPLDTSNLARKSELELKTDKATLSDDIKKEIGSDYVSIAGLEKKLAKLTGDPTLSIDKFVKELNSRHDSQVTASDLLTVSNKVDGMKTKVDKFGNDVCNSASVTCVPYKDKSGKEYQDLDAFFALNGPGYDSVKEAALSLKTDTAWMKALTDAVPGAFTKLAFNELLDEKGDTGGAFAEAISDRAVANFDTENVIGQISDEQATNLFGKVGLKEFNDYMEDYIKFTPDGSHHLNEATSVVIVPAGTIVAHRDSLAPDGWVVCDGVTLGPDGIKTPDLRGRFILGAGNYPTGNSLENNTDANGDFIHRDRLDVVNKNFAWANQGNSGGDAKNLLTSDNVPEHRHHEFVTNWETPDPHGVRNKNLTGNEFVSSRGFHDGMIHTEYWMSGTGAETFSKQEPADGLSGKPTDVDGNLVTTTPHNNLPPYYSLIYIMKL
jgi:microcystin-dependent protein